MTPKQKTRIAAVADALVTLSKPQQKRALKEPGKLPTKLNLDKANPKVVGPLVNALDKRIKTLSDRADALITAIDAKKESKVMEIMKSMQQQIDALQSWLTRDLSRAVTASAKLNRTEAQKVIARAKLAARRGERFLASV